MPTAIPTPSTPGRRVVKVASGAGQDFATVPDFVTYLASQNPKGNNEILIAEFYQDFTTGDNFYLPPANQDADHYVIIRPVPGLAVSDIDTSIFGYGASGIEIVVLGEMKLRVGVRMEGFRIDVQGNGKISMGGPGGIENVDTNINHLVRNRIRFSGTNPTPIECGEYEVKPIIEDNLIIDTTGSAAVRINSFAGEFERNTCVSTASNRTATFFYANRAVTRNNAFYNLGPAPYNGISQVVEGNSTNIALTTPTAGIDVDTVNPFFQGASNYIPAIGGPLDGTAPASANSINDNRGANRGLNPDRGAWQRVPATPLPTGTVIGDPIPDGQDWIIDFTTTQNPTSGTASLAPATVNPGNAIGMQGVVTFGTGTGRAVFTGITPGGYKGDIIIGNDGGTAHVAGIPALSILEVSGNPVAPATTGGEVPSPTVSGVSVSPTTATGSTQFSASVLGTNSPPQVVTWSKIGGGTLSINGAFVAPAQTSAIQTITIKAASQFDPNVFGLATVTIAAATVVLPPDEPPDDPGTPQVANRFARPASDITPGLWEPSSGTDLFAMLNEADLDLTDFIQTYNPTACEIALGHVADPGTSSNQAVRYEAHAPDGGNLTVVLKQGNTVIATRTHSALPVLPTVHELILTPDQCDAITDYGDLRVELVVA